MALQVLNDGGTGGPYPGMSNNAVQSYAPLQAKRELTPRELAAIQKGLGQTIPKLSPGYSTPITELLANPTKQSVAVGLAGAAIGLAFGAAMRGGAPTTILGGVLGAIIGGSVGAQQYLTRRRRNENYLALIQTLPEGATLRDVLADPAVQADLNRRAVGSLTSTFV